MLAKIGMIIVVSTFVLLCIFVIFCMLPLMMETFISALRLWKEIL